MDINTMKDLVIPLTNGRKIVCSVGEIYSHGSAVYILDKNNNEIMCWEAKEWAEEPELVMGAILRCAAGY